MVGGKEFSTEVVVVSPLTSEAILGLNFLQEQHASIDLGCQTLHLKESGCDIALQHPAPVSVCSAEQQVHSANTVEVPPHSRMEIAASVETTVEET